MVDADEMSCLGGAGWADVAPPAASCPAPADRASGAADARGHGDATITRLVDGLALTMEAAACDPALRLSELPVPPTPSGAPA